MNHPRTPFSVSLRDVAGTVVVMLVAIACVKLGFWQLDRLHQRRERNASIRARLTGPAVELTSTPPDSSGWLHRRVVIRGTFDTARTIVMPGRYLEGSPGVHVLTPVLLGGGDAVLADRGWVPAVDGASVNPASLPPATDAADTGIVVPFPGEEHKLGKATAAYVRGSNESFRRVWFEVDERALRAQFPYRLGAIQVRLLPERNAAGLPVREPPPPLDEGPHLGYAIQWFSFAVIAIAGWLTMVMKSRSRAGRAKTA